MSSLMHASLVYSQVVSEDKSFFMWHRERMGHPVCGFTGVVGEY